jgi:hypothetical protein
MLNIRFGIVQFQIREGKKHLQLFHANDFEISSPQHLTHYSPAGNGNVLDIVVQQNIRDSQ